MSYTETAAKLPDFFIPLLQKQYGEEDVHRIVEGLACRRATTLRANTLLSNAEEVAAAFDEAGIAYEIVPWYSDAFQLEAGSERMLRELPIYQEGKIYLQSLSSMLPPLAMGIKPGTDILDMCAAPGGKTTQMAALGGGKAHITACEMHAPRADKLEHNLEHQGARGVNVLRCDARRLDSFFSFDQVLLDAPCSGSGTLWVDDYKLAKRFNEGLLAKCSKQQRALLPKALEVMKPGSTMVYSTCSVLQQENEDVVRESFQRMKKKGAWKIVPAGIDEVADLPLLPTTMEGTLCVCPNESFEGFFVAKIKRVA